MVEGRRRGGGKHEGREDEHEDNEGGNQGGRSGVGGVGERTRGGWGRSGWRGAGNASLVGVGGPRECGRDARRLARGRDDSVALARSGPGRRHSVSPTCRCDSRGTPQASRCRSRARADRSSGGEDSRRPAASAGHTTGDRARGGQMWSARLFSGRDAWSRPDRSVLGRRAPPGRRARAHRPSGVCAWRAGRRPRRPRACRGRGAGPGVHAVFAWPAARVAACGCSVGARGTERKPLASLGLGLTAALRVRSVRVVAPVAAWSATRSARRGRRRT
jgi:hypothetical protein